MSSPKPVFEELDYQKTDIGELILRRRTILSLDDRLVYEIILGDDFLMSSLFTVVEVALSKLGLELTSKQFSEDTQLDVVVGGLGLGYTAKEALVPANVKTVTVVDYLKPVIEWHEKGLVPLGPELTADPRCTYRHGDFFALALASVGEPSFCEAELDKQFHAVLLDIDHSPEKLLSDGNATFYTRAGLEKFANKLLPGGVFGLWSDDPPEETFMAALGEVFATCESHIVPFYNPLQDRESKSTVYLATTNR